MTELATPMAVDSEAGVPSRLDPQGRYIAHSEISYATVGFYVLLILLLLAVNGHSSFFLYPGVPAFLAVVLAVFLARYLSTRYSMDSEYVRAWRIFGSRKLRIEDVRRIQFATLRELGGVGMFGSWGWRGRLWSPIDSVGTFDAIYTVSRGLLVSGRGIPIFISPHDPPAFARELSRRVRSEGVVLEDDVPKPGR